MNICTVGTSWITESFISSSKFVPNVNIYACYSRKEEKARAFAEKNGIKKYFSDFDKMLEDKNIDALYIASPNVLHFEQSVRALKARKNVICEKPAVVTTSQMNEIFETAEKNGVIFMEAMKSMHSPGLKALRKNFSKAGKIRTAHLDFSQRSSKIDSYYRGELPNIFNPKMCTGGLMDLGVYNIYVACELFGEPKEIISHLDFLDTGSDITGTVIFVYDDLTVNITYSKAANGFVQSKILGDMGAFLIGSLSKLSGISFIDNEKNETPIYDEPNEHRIMSYEIEEFERIVREGDIERYRECKEMSILVNKLLSKIREQNNFDF